MWVHLCYRYSESDSIWDLFHASQYWCWSTSFLHLLCPMLWLNIDWSHCGEDRIFIFTKHWIELTEPCYETQRKTILLMVKIEIIINHKESHWVNFQFVLYNPWYTKLTLSMESSNKESSVTKVGLGYPLQWGIMPVRNSTSSIFFSVWCLQYSLTAGRVASSSISMPFPGSSALGLLLAQLQLFQLFFK